MKIAITLLNLLTSTTPATAASSSPADTTVPSPSAHGLIIEVKPSTFDADQVQTWLKKAGRQALETNDIDLATDDRITIRVDGEIYDYHFMFTATRQGRLVGSDMMKCKCSNDKLSEQVSASIARAAEWLAEDRQEPTAVKAEPKPEPDALTQITAPRIDPEFVRPPAVADRAESTAGTSAEHRKSRRMRTAGIIALSTGSALLIAGAGMLAAGQQDLTTRYWPHYKRNWQPLGYALAGVGIAGVAAGGTLLTLVSSNPASFRRNAQRRHTRTLARRAN